MTLDRIKSRLPGTRLLMESSKLHQNETKSNRTNRSSVQFMAISVNVSQHYNIRNCIRLIMKHARRQSKQSCRRCARWWLKGCPLKFPISGYNYYWLSRLFPPRLSVLHGLVDRGAPRPGVDPRPPDWKFGMPAAVPLLNRWCEIRRDAWTDLISDWRNTHFD